MSYWFLILRARHIAFVKTPSFRYHCFERYSERLLVEKREFLPSAASAPPHEALFED